MQRIICKAKIHGATVTEANLDYNGSITIDEDLMQAADILENERVQVVNLNNGERLETYAIKGEHGSGVICMNGPAALKCKVGDEIHIISYAIASETEAKKIKIRLIKVDDKNKPL